MKVNCPRCQKETPWESNNFRPFCSERCQKLDLGGWAAEEHRVPCAEDDEISEEDSKALENSRNGNNTE